MAFLCVIIINASEPETPPVAQASTSADAAESHAIVPRPIAVLPFTNRSERGAPLREIRSTLMRKLSERGLDLLGEEKLAEFMRRHRMRYTEGLSREMAERIGAETGAWAALITTVDLYDDRVPPKMALTSRLVTTDEKTRILWMDSVIRIGDQAPGGFDMGLIFDFALLEERVLSDLAAAVASKPTASSRKTRRRFRPASHYASPDFPVIRDKAARIAVLPFANDSAAKYAGEILTDQLIRHLVEVGANVVEPGILRQVMLEARQFYTEGPSDPEAELLRLHLSADVVLFGEVMRFEEKLEPRAAQVEFLVRAIDTESGQLVWASNSFAGGNKGVFFFGAGRVHAAQALASEMSRALVTTALRERDRLTRKR